MKLWKKVLIGAAMLIAGSVITAIVHANVQIARLETRAPDEGAPGRMLTIDGHRWHVVEHGDPAQDPTGAPILLVHGFAVAGLQTFEPWASEQLRGRSLILPDLLGYGHSERIPTAGSWYSVQSYSDALVQLLDQLGVRQVDLISHSFGGSVALRFALDHPERVRRIVFISAAIYVEPSAAEGIVQLPLGIGRAVTWHAFGAGPWSINVLGCRDRGCQWVELAKIRDTTATLRAMMRSTREFPAAQELMRDLPGLKTRPLIIWGRKDNIVPLIQGERLAEATGGRLVIIDNSVHMPHLREPERVGGIVREFLDQG